jgi:predicted PhzF superfamily epimerase YddE/YHI9
MKEFDIFQVDAFTDHVFGGNPAAVIPLTEWLSDTTLQNIAMENNLSETVFIVPSSTSDFHIRWFTPTIEVRLCGHATLATAHVLWHHLNFSKNEITFDSLSGILKVEKIGKSYTLDFPVDTFEREDVEQHPLTYIFNIRPLYIYKCKDDYLTLFSSAIEILELEVDFVALKKINARGVITTAIGTDVDFVSRCFYPEAGIEEDPVTGSAHTALTPFWAGKLGVNVLKARQLSKRRGDLLCELKGERVLITGDAKTYLIGKIFLDL